MNILKRAKREFKTRACKDVGMQDNSYSLQRQRHKGAVKQKTDDGFARGIQVGRVHK